MRQVGWLACVLVSLAPLARAGEPAPRPLATGLKNPTSVAVGADGRVFVAVAGELGKDGDGAVLVLGKGGAAPLADGLDDPTAIAAYQGRLFVADKQRVWHFDPKGRLTVFAAADAFPQPPRALADVAVDPESGTVYVTDVGDEDEGGAIYRISPKGKVGVLTDARRYPALRRPGGLTLDGASFLLVLDAGSGELHRVNAANGAGAKVAATPARGGGLAWDYHGRLFSSGGPDGKAFVRDTAGTVHPLSAVPRSAGDPCLDPTGKFILVPVRQAGTVTAVPAAVPGAPVDDRPLPIETAVAFPDLKWAGWTGETETGLTVPLRPLVLTHAGDGSNRVFVATQRGVIHVFPNDPKAARTKVFLDIQHKVRYDDKTNEEGFLGLAFHPRYKETGEFFVFYTDRKAKLTNVLSRFKVSKDDPDRADPDSEEELFRVQRPFWNHDGGTVCFGPDGYLYVALGDGGAAGDPFNNAQNLKTLLGSVLRLDIDRKADGKPYAIPPDNPFVGLPERRPEIWAYGLRNVWRMAFDRKTGQLWAADVGQNLYEEIDLLRAGGNYGWKLREGFHPFGPGGSGRRKGLIEPIWEYHHDVGKSMTGGVVYRGPGLPELDGMYLYGDYISCKIWALRYDPDKGRVVANRPIRDRNLPLLSFGEDEAGEVYFLTYTTTGQGIYRFVRAAPAAEGKGGGRGGR